MGNGNWDFGSFHSCGSLNKDFVILLNEFLSRALQRIRPKFRFIIVPRYDIRSSVYIINYNKFFPDGIDCSLHLSPELFNEFTNIYRELILFTEILTSGSNAPEYILALFEFVGCLINVKSSDIRKYYDPVKNKFRLFEALDYFLFKSGPFSRNNNILLCYYLKYTTKYNQLSKKGIMKKLHMNNKDRLPELVKILNYDISTYILKFAVFKPWINYKTSLGLSDGFTKFNSCHLNSVKDEEHAENVTLIYMIKVLCVIYGYCRRSFSNGKSYYHYLIKKELAVKFHISSSDQNIELQKSIKKTHSHSELEKIFCLISSNISKAG